MDCRGCGGANREGARFCTFCGAALAVTCPSCGTELIEGARFCDSCGSPVGIEPAAEPVVAARKVVTVLFADMTGSTALEEQLDAERVRALVDRFYATLRAEVEKRGGRVVKFTGDGLMAAFGVPEVHEDDALRAIEAATAMCSACTDLAAQVGFPSVSLKVGVNTGEVVVIEDDDDVVGDAVNVASRLEGAAAAGEVLVGEETWRLTRSISRYEPIEPLALKGKSEPVPAYRLLGISDGLADTLAAPFIGREHELDVLLAAFDEAVASNAARLVTVIGSPGLGKTRLTREFGERVAGRAVVRETRCDPTSATFAPIAEALREANEIPEAADEEEVLTALLDHIPEEEPERERMATLAAAILGVGHPGSTEETFWALRRMIETAAARDLPRVLVLEDLHWAEPLLLDLVEHLAEWIREGPVLLIGTARPELRDQRPSLVEGGRPYAVLALEGLDEVATEKLAVGLLGTEEVPGDLLAKIPESTEGNPLFVREFVRMLVDDGVLQRTSSGWDVSVDVDAIEVPPTIQSLLAARVDRLRSDERTVIELAAVIGKEFYRGALDELAPPTVRDQIESALESLRRKELVEPAGTYWIDEPVYRFHHVLIRDAAYRRLLKETRADVHERMADWLERKTSGVLGEHEELIGFHLEQAHEYKRQLGSSDDALGGRAAALLGEAAQRALDRDDLTAAASLSGRALMRLPGDVSERSTLLVIRCEALLSMGDVSSGGDAVRELEELADTPRLQAWAACFAGQLASLIAPERLQEIEKRVSAAAVELAELGDPAGAAKAHTVHGSTLARLGRFAECESALDAALTAAREANDRRRITAVLGSAPLAALWGPNPVSRAGGRCLDLVRLSRITTGSPGVEVTSTRCQAVLEAFRGRADAARRMLRGARRTLTELGLKHELLETEQFAGIVELVAGDAAAAVSHLEEAHDGFRFVGVDVSAAQTAALLARAHLRLGELEEAETLANESEELGGQDLKASIAWRAVRAELLAQRGEFEKARLLAESAVELASRTDALIDHGDACSALAAVCAAAGDAAAARSASERAFALYERKGATTLIGSTQEQLVAPSSSEGLTDVLDNDAVRVFRAMGESFEARDWERFGSLLDEDAIFDDRRPLVSNPVRGRRAIVEVGRSIADSGVLSAPLAVIAIRGQRLMLGKTMLRGRELGSTAFETEVLAIVSLNAQGLIDIWMPIDSQDMAAAFAELDARFLAGEGAEHSQLVNLWRSYVEMYNRRDWSGERALLADDFVYVDHRLTSLGVVSDPDEYVQALAHLIDLIPGRRAYLTNLPRLDPGSGICTLDLPGEAADGGRPEEGMHLIGIVDGDRFNRIEHFPENRLADAIARLDELRGRPESASRLENECIRVLHAFLRTFEARDWEALAAHHREDFAMYDRRLGLGMTYRGRDTQVEVLKGTADVGTTNAELSPIAIRGERLSLVSTVWRGPTASAFGSEFLAVSEIDENGRIAEIVVFSVDGFDGAVAELDRRFLEGDGAHFASVVRLVSELVATYNQRDWIGHSQLISDSSIGVDHHPAASGTTIGFDQAYYQQLINQAPDINMCIVGIPWLTANAGLFQIRSSGTSLDGGAVELAFLGIAVVRGDKLVRFERFATEDMEAALARFDELGTPQIGPSSLGNLAARLGHRIYECGERRDFEAIDELLAEDCRAEDRRRGLHWTGEGREALGERPRALASVGFDRFRFAVMATRGENLALGRGSWTFAQRDEPSEIEVLQLFESDDEGRLREWVAFDPDDLGAAFAELEERYAAGEGAGLPVLAFFAPVRALNRADWDELRSLCSDDLVVADHRPASLGELDGADRYVEAVRQLRDVIPDIYSYVAEVHALTEVGGVVDFVTRGTSIDGSSVELLFKAVALYDSGRASRIEFFPVDQLDDALARWEALNASQDAGGPLENTASTALHRVFDRLVDQDWDGIASLLAPDCTWDDTRPGLRVSTRGRDASIEQLRVIALGTPSVEDRVVAIRGDRLALVDLTFTSGTFEVDLYALCESDASDLLAYSASYGPDDLDIAMRDLDDRYLAGEGSVYAEALRTPARFVGALNDRDLNALSELLSPDLVFQDHRAASLGVIRSREEWVESVRVVHELGTTSHLIVRFSSVERDRVLLELLTEVSTRDQDVPFEVAFHLLIQINDGLIHGLEVFPIDALDAALARFEDLSTVALENLCTRTVDRLNIPYSQDDWTAAAELFAEDVAFEDNRLGLGTRTTGRATLIEHMEFALSAIARNQRTVLSTRGELSALQRNLYEFPDGSEIELLAVFHCGQDGLIERLTLFEPSDMERAVAELEAAGKRFDELGGDPVLENACVRQLRRMWELFDKEDWGGVAALYAIDHVSEDRRAGLRTTLSGEANVENLKALRAVGGTEISMTPLAVRGERLSLVRHGVKGPAEEASFENAVLVLTELESDGSMGPAIVFEPDDIDSAFAELDERYAAGEGAPYAEILDLGSMQRRALAEGDWKMYRELIDEDVELVDHRPASLGEMHGSGDVLEALKAFPVMSNLRPRAVAIHAIAPNRTLIEASASATSEHGAAVEMSHLRLQQLRDRKVVRIELYPVDALRDAKARFDELGPASSQPRLANAASRVMQRDRDLEAREDWDALASDIADDAVVEDRRSGFGWRIEGKHNVLDHVRLATARVRIDAEVLAIRGDNLALERQLISRNDFEVEVLTLCELNDRGQIRHTAIFGADARDAALAELHERYAEGEGREFADQLRLGAKALDAMNVRDWETFASTIAHDVIFIDHRPASMGEIKGGRELVRLVKELTGIAPDVRHSIPRIPAISASCSVIEYLVEGTNAEGGSIEISYLQAFVIRDGQVARAERYGVDQFDEALARFEELRADLQAPADASFLQWQKRFDELCRSRDWPAVAELLDQDAVFDDRRLGMGLRLVGRPAVLEHLKTVTEGVVSRRASARALATRGERLGLFRFVIAITSGYEIDMLAVHEFTEDWRQSLNVLFDPDDLDAAFAELDHRYISGRGAPFAEVLRLGVDAISAVNMHDWPRVLSLHAAYYVFVDHQAVGFGTTVGPPHRWVEQVTRLVPDIRLELRAVHKLGANGGVFRVAWSGHDSVGNSVEGETVDVVLMASGLIVRREQYSADRLDDALARFDELTTPAQQLDNDCLRTLRQLDELSRQGNWEGFADLMPDVTLEDRREGLGMRLEGRDAVLPHMRMAHEAADEIAHEPIATRGNDLALLREMVRLHGDFDVESLLLLDNRRGPDQRCSIITFDPDDLDGAFAELDDRYMLGEGAPFAEVWRTACNLNRGYNARDWISARRALADDAVLVDHRPIFLGELTPDQWIDSVRVQTELAPDTYVLVPFIHYIDDSVVAFEVHGSGTSTDGAEFEIGFICVFAVRDGVIQRYEWFASESVTEAVERSRVLSRSDR